MSAIFFTRIAYFMPDHFRLLASLYYRLIQAPDLQHLQPQHLQPQHLQPQHLHPQHLHPQHLQEILRLDHCR